MQFWPRKKASRPYPRIRNQHRDTPGLAGFAGYKVGMTHVMLTDNKPTSMTKGEEVFCPVTVIECPPIKIASIRFYKNTTNGLALSHEILNKLDKELGRKISLPKKETLAALDKLSASDFSDIRINVYTQPSTAGVGKKKPELFELSLGGSLEDKMSYAKDHLAKEITVTEVLKEGQQLDTFAVTKGKGLQGPIKRFGVTRRGHKSEKGVRRVGNLGAWTGNRSWTVARAGQMGFHNRMERNKLLLKISSDPAEINAKGGYLRYGNVKTTFILVKGSVQGPAKRLIRFIASKRPDHRIPDAAPSIDFISLDSKQGR